MLLLGCGSVAVNAWHHEPDIAAKSAVAFSQTAFVDGDADSAFRLLSPELAKTTSSSSVADVLRGMHPDGRPASVKAIEYEPLPGYRGMNILVLGHSDVGDFYYRLLMDGTAEAGYKVSGFWRGTGPYPSANKHKLQ